MNDDDTQSGYEKARATLEELLGSVHLTSGSTRDQTFQMMVVGLQLRSVLNPDEVELACLIAALALTDAALARRDREQTERTVVA